MTTHATPLADALTRSGLDYTTIEALTNGAYKVFISGRVPGIPTLRAKLDPVGLQLDAAGWSRFEGEATWSSYIVIRIRT